MASASYSYYYVIDSGSVGGNVTYNGLQFPNAIGNIDETDTNSSDGVVAVGDTVSWQWLGAYEVIGVTEFGEPIIQQISAGPSSALFVLSNTPGQENDTVATSTSSYTMCFLAGSKIAVKNGETAVEDLEIGDTVRTANGKDVVVKWIGRQTVFSAFGPAERLMPVCISAGALGNGVPHSDLTVTADHGMLVEGVICHASALVNGTTITRVPLSEMGETYTVYHIETENHEIILANGAPAETFIDNVSRRAFDNFAEFEALYGDVPEMQELPYPRAMSARQVLLATRGNLKGTAAA